MVCSSGGMSAATTTVRWNGSKNIESRLSKNSKRSSQAIRTIKPPLDGLWIFWHPAGTNATLPSTSRTGSKSTERQYSSRQNTTESGYSKPITIRSPSKTLPSAKRAARNRVGIQNFEKHSNQNGADVSLVSQTHRGSSEALCIASYHRKELLNSNVSALVPYSKDALHSPLSRRRSFEPPKSLFFQRNEAPAQVVWHTEIPKDSKCPALLMPLASV